MFGIVYPKETLLCAAWINFWNFNNMFKFENERHLILMDFSFQL